MAQSMPSQPKTFKEYRKIKEEQEKQRREYQNNLRKQQEEKERKIKEETESRLKAEEVEEEKDKELHVFTIDDYDDEDTMSAKELKQKRKEKLQKLAESKDPRKRKLLLGKEREKEKKEPPPSAVIKSFKIPKVKKNSTEESKLVKPEKLAEVDIFKPLEIKNSLKTDLSPSRKKRKLEKFITRPLKEDSSSEIEILLEKPPPVQDLPSENVLPSSPLDDHKAEGDKTINPADTSSQVPAPARAPSPAQAPSPAPDPVIDVSDSDSEPGLTIAEEVERRLSRSSESDTHATPDRQVSRSSESEHSATPDKRVLQSSGSETLARSSKNETLTIPDGLVSQSNESEIIDTPDKKASISSKSDGFDAPDKQISQSSKIDTHSIANSPIRIFSSKSNILSKPNRSISQSIELETATGSGNHDPPEVTPLVVPLKVAPLEVAPLEVALVKVAPVKVALEEIAPEEVASEKVAPEEVVQEERAPVEVAAEDLPAGPSSKPEISTLPMLSKSDLTKELLKSIVSTLDPAGAKKLLEKASRMDQVDKISLTDLRGLLAQDSTDSEDDSPPMKVARKKSRTGGRNSENRKAVKKVEKSQENISPITSRTRQCKRQMVSDEHEVEGSLGKEEEEEIIPDVIANENVFPFIFDFQICIACFGRARMFCSCCRPLLG